MEVVNGMKAHLVNNINISVASPSSATPFSSSKMTSSGQRKKEETMEEGEMTSKNCEWGRVTVGGYGRSGNDTNEAEEEP